MKIISQNGFEELLRQIKNYFVLKANTEEVETADLIEASTINIDSSPTSNSNNLITSGGVYSELSKKANNSELKTVAKTGSYTDLINKPSIGNATITVQKNGTGIKSFTLNQNTNETINVQIPTDLNQFADANGIATADILYQNSANQHQIQVSKSGTTPTSWITIPDTNTTYTLQQDATDGHKIIFTPSTGTATEIIIPDNNTVYANASTSAAGLMSSTDKKKLDGITSGAQPNQNAFSNIAIGGATFSANSATDTLTLTAGNNVTISPNSTNNNITISATDTTYTLPGLIGTTNSIGSVTKPVYWNGSNFAPITSYEGKSNAAGQADKVANSLSFTVGGESKGSFDGSVQHTIDVNAADLNISGALQYIGRTSTVPVTSQVVLSTGSIVDVVPGNVVIYIGNDTTVIDNGETVSISKGTEFLYDNNNTWVVLGSATSYSIKPHIHGNIDSSGHLTDDSGDAVTNTILKTNGIGEIIKGPSFGSDLDRYLRNDGAWANLSKSNIQLENVANIDQSKAIKSITRDGTTFTYTCLDNTTGTFTQQDENTWRGIQDNLTSTSEVDSLSAKQGKILNDSKANNSTVPCVAYGTCSTAAAIAEKIVTLTSTTKFELIPGAIIGVKFSKTNSVGNVTLNVNNTGAKSIFSNTSVYTDNSTLITGATNRIIYYMYDGEYWVWLGNSKTPTDTIPGGYCTTAGNTAAKVASHTGYILASNTYEFLTISKSNTNAGALTLNINSKGAKPIYINGSASSSSNYNIPAGTYVVFYDGTNYYINTDGTIPGTISKATKLATARTISLNGDISGNATSFDGSQNITISTEIDPSKQTQYFTDIELMADAWTLQDAGYYTQIKSGENGLLTTDIPHVYFQAPNNFADLENEQESFSLLYNCDTPNNGSIRFYAKELPEYNFKVSVEVHRI